MISRNTLTALAVVLALAGCDRKPASASAPSPGSAAPVDPSLPHERVEPVAWNAAQGAFTFEGKPMTAGRI